MLKVRNKAKYAVDEIAPGDEGLVPHNRATRALVDAGVLEVLEELAPMRVKGAASPPGLDSHPNMQDLIDSVRRRGERLAELDAEIERRGVRISELEAENAALREQLAALPPAKNKKHPAEG